MELETETLSLRQEHGVRDKSMELETGTLSRDKSMELETRDKSMELETGTLS